MANILNATEDYNPKNGLKNIFTKLIEIIKALNANTNAIAAMGNPKVYKALLTQSGTDAPVATVLVNTLSGTPVWSYVDVGQYTVTLTDEFTELKTFISNTSNSGEYAGETGVLFSWSNVNSLYMESFKDGAYSNGISTVYLTIEVYP